MTYNSLKMHAGVSFALCTSSLTSLVHEGESEGQEQPASPQTGKFSHNTHIQACHVQLAPQIFSATVLFSAPLSRKHSCRLIGASWRSLPTVSDGETAISNTLSMRISRGKPCRRRLEAPIAERPYRNTL